MSTFAATGSIGARPTSFRRKAALRLDEEAKIFLVGELVIAVVAMVLAGLSWWLATGYHVPWALWQARMLLVVASWPVYLIVKAWASRLLKATDPVAR